MRVLDIRALRGPNVFHTQPVLVMRVNLEDLTERASDEIEGFNARLVSLLPGLKEHHCSPGRPGGFVERLERGTYMAHIIEHVALDLSGPAGIEVSFGKSIHAGIHGVYKIAVRYRNEEAMSLLLRESVRLVQAVVDARRIDLDQIVSRARKLNEETSLGPSSQVIVDAAEKRGIPWRRLGSGSLLQLGYGKNRKRVQTAVTDRTSLIAADLVQDKEATKRVLLEACVPVPQGFRARRSDDVRDTLSSLRAPWVVKPVDGHHGQGVTMGLTTLDEVLAACEVAWAAATDALIEEQCQGCDFRILVVDGKFVASSLRRPAHVVGDGHRTIRELVDSANRDPRRGEGHANVLTRIELDASVEAYLLTQSHSLDGVPAPGETVHLRQTANLSTGGTAADVTGSTHESIKKLSERIARTLGLDICGIDLIHSDISSPVGPRTAVIEVNAGPGLRMHVAPSEGESRDVGGAIVEMLYPPGTPSRIPIASVTGTNGKTTVARLIAHIAGVDGTVAGLTCSDGIWIGGELIEKGDTTGPHSARLVLSDPSVDVAVLETARGGIMKSGLGYDWSDVAVVTNVKADHIGQDGIEGIEDLIRVKSIVAERVHDKGILVLNADDPEAARLPETARLRRSRRSIVYYSHRSDNPLVRQHLREGGHAYCVTEGWLCELSDAEVHKIARVAELRFAFSGTAAYQVSNALAATAAARALGISREQIVRGLLSFRASRHNAGRTNVYKIGSGYLILDYGHNPDAIANVTDMIRAWKPTRSTAVLGLPGDRVDALIEECAVIASRGFDSLILRDDIDLRERSPGEVPKVIENHLFAKGLRHENDSRLRTILCERTAIRTALEEIGEGEIVVVFYDDFEVAMSVIRDFDPAPVDGLPLLVSKPSLERLRRDVQPTMETHR